MQQRQGNTLTFFKHKNQRYPPSLPDRGKLRLGKKSDLHVFYIQKQKSVAFDVKVLDSATIVHLLSTNGVSTFDNRASDVLIPYIKKYVA